MNSTNIKERQMLQEWAAANSDSGALDKESAENEDTYFITRKRVDTYMMQYKFENIPQLQEGIAKVCGDQIDPKTQKLLAVAAFKCRKTQSEDTQTTEMKNSVDRGKLPEFTYAF